MTQQIIRWLPSPSPNVVAYEILKSDTGIAGDYTRLTMVLHQIPGFNWDEDKSCFYFKDDEVVYRYYRIRVLDRYGNVAEDTAPLPFQGNNDPVKTASLHMIALTADMGKPGNFKYVTAGGSPIKDAVVRVYKKVDYVTNQLNKVVGTSLTDSWGKWSPPIFVEPGETYTIVWHKPNEYGPDTEDITL